MEFGLSVCQQFDLTFQVEAATRVVLFLKWLAEQHGKNQNIGNTKTRSKFYNYIYISRARWNQVVLYI